MSTRADHLETQEALPWLANGTLAGAELQRVENHLQVCALCREELALLHTLHAAGPGPAPQTDVDGALARLLPQLDAQPVLQPAPAVLPKSWRQRLAANDRSWLRAGVFLQCCVIAVLGVQLARPFGGEAAPNGSYRALGANGGNQGSLVVAFKPDTPERELRRIVLASGARVAGGPTATGAWMLETEKAPAAVLERLRAEPAVLLAQPLGVEGRP
ncbi:MAG: hypothetical protein JWP59_4681 [Massilia sp.]|nr:hypothetical protein [Massilia sp.]